MATAVITATLPQLTVATNTAQIWAASVAVTLPQLTTTISVETPMSATITTVLPQLTASIAAAPPMSATITTVLPQLTASIAAAAPVLATVTATLPQLTASLTAAPPITAQLVATLPQLTVAGAAARMNIATIRISYAVNMGLKNWGIDGTGGAVVPASTGAYIFDDPSINVGSGGVSIGGAATVVVPSNFVEAGSGGVVTGGAATVAEYALNPVMAVSFRAPTVLFPRVNSGAVNLTSPSLRVSFSGLIGARGAISMRTPRMRVAMSGGASQVAVSYPLMTVVMRGNQVYVGALVVAVPKMSVSLQGSAARVGIMDVHMPVPGVSMAGRVGVGGALTVALQPASVLMTGSPGNYGAMAVTFPAPAVALAGFTQITGTLAVTAPAIAVDLIGTIRTQLMLMLVTNATTGAVSTYEGMAINSMCQLGDTVFFADATGIHVMDADADNTVAIDASVQTGFMDLGSDVQKRITDMYLGMRADDDLTLSVGVDEQPAYEYTMSPHGVNTLKQRRAAIGKGIRGKYWQFGITNTAGCDFDLDTIDIAVADTDRRI